MTKEANDERLMEVLVRNMIRMQYEGRYGHPCSDETLDDIRQLGRRNPWNEHEALARLAIRCVREWDAADTATASTPPERGKA